MFYLLFIVYFIAACYCITKIPFVQKAGLGAKMILLLFILKIAAGCLLGWISERYAPQSNDYWVLNYFGKTDYALLLKDPRTFFLDIFSSPYTERGSFFGSVGSYWNDLRNNLIIKMIALFNIFSRGNYYINSLFFNFIGFFGHIALYRVFIHVYKNGKWPAITGCFLLPSTLYFSSGLHKDCIVFTALGLCCFGIYFLLEEKARTKYLLLGLASFCVLLFIRNYVAIAMIPCLAAWLICKKYGTRQVYIYASVFIAGLLGILLMEQLSPAAPVKIIAQKQADFFSIDLARSQFEMDTIQPTVKSLLDATPMAANHSFMRPYVWEFPGQLLQLTAFEMLAYQLLFLLMLFFYKKNNGLFNGFSIALGLLLLLFIGYITPNAGSLVRYRSLYLPLLLTPVLCHINWERIKKHTTYYKI